MMCVCIWMQRSLGEGRMHSHEDRDDDSVRRASSQDDEDEEPRPKKFAVTYGRSKGDGNSSKPEVSTVLCESYCLKTYWI